MNGKSRNRGKHVACISRLSVIIRRVRALVILFTRENYQPLIILLFCCRLLTSYLKIMSTATATEGPKGPFKLVTVNTAPERALRLIGRVTEALKERYAILHVANCEGTCEMNLDKNKLKRKIFK